MKKGEEMQGEWVEVLEAEEREPVLARERAIPVFIQEGDVGFEKRMDNWRRVVRGSIGGGSGGFCAGWARLYVQHRDEAERAELVKRLLELPLASPTRTKALADELDGWLVEAAVRSLPDYDQRRVLQFWYVWQYPEHWIKSKLMLRRGAVRRLLGRAQVNVKNVLRSVNTAANILSNNSHAGKDPRPESKDVP